MKKICNFIGWAIDGNPLMYKGFNLMSELNSARELFNKTKYIGLYPQGIPKQENYGKKLLLTPVEIIGTDIKFAYIEFSMCYYMFFEI